MIDVNRFWDDNRRIEDEELRVMIAETVINVLECAGWTRSQFTARRYRHPMIRRKDYARRFSLADILADFIMMTRQATEKKAEYPVRNAEARLYDRRRARKRHTEVDYEHMATDGGIYGVERSARARMAGINSENF